MATMTLEQYFANLRKRFFTVKQNQRFVDIAEEVGMKSFNLQRFARGARPSWEKVQAIEAWIIAQEKAQGESR